MEVSVWLQLGRSTRREHSAGTHYLGGLVGVDIDALEKSCPYMYENMTLYYFPYVNCQVLFIVFTNRNTYKLKASKGTGEYA
jgi:hypothetical protein